MNALAYDRAISELELLNKIRTLLSRELSAEEETVLDRLSEDAEWRARAAEGDQQ